MLLHIRAFLQVELVRQLTEETYAALADYESTLVEGLCEDCFMWNCDIYGTDVWEWVENGYKNVCDCCVKGIDNRVFSTRKINSMQQYGQLNIRTRRQWLEAYISHSYLGGQDIWETMNEAVIRYFDCNAIPQDAEIAQPACIPLEGGRYMLQKLKRGDDFGSKVLIEPFDGAPDSMVGLLLRELAADGDVEVPTSSAEREFPFPTSCHIRLTIELRRFRLFTAFRPSPLKTDQTSRIAARNIVRRKSSPPSPARCFQYHPERTAVSSNSTGSRPSNVDASIFHHVRRPCPCLPAPFLTRSMAANALPQLSMVPSPFRATSAPALHTSLRFEHSIIYIGQHPKGRIASLKHASIVSSQSPFSTVNP